MTSDENQAKLNLIEDFRPRLLRLIEVQPVLDRLTFIGIDQKDLIRNKARHATNSSAASLLLDTIIKSPLQEGWFREFVDALEEGGCKYAANYVDSDLPSPSLEAENDYCVRLIEILSPSLVNILKTNDVCENCYALEMLTKEDREIITSETTNKGNINGARELLRRIVRNPPGWFSNFLKALQNSGHTDLASELIGETFDDDLKDESDKSNSGLTEEEPPASLSDDTVMSPSEKRLSDSSVGNISYASSSGESTEPSSQATDLDLYRENPGGEESQPRNNMDYSTSERSIEGATGSPQNTTIVLRDYQMAVAEPALEGKNIIICLPTGSGKTRVAVYITKEHLDGRKKEKQPGKVVVLVNKVPLVEQHYSKEFNKFLKGQYRVERVSGDSQLKISFSEVVKNNDIIICTAQILENSFEKAQNGEEDGIPLSALTLIVIDECHHTKKGQVYNSIMVRYLKQKFSNAKRRKLQKDPVPIPQILGLTASPGVGEAKDPKKAQEHILQICANLDASALMTGNSVENHRKPLKVVLTVEEREEDPFGNVIKGIMSDIHLHAELKPSCDLGTQNYEQWVVHTEQNAAKEENQKGRVCAEHLRQYNEALHQSNTIRMADAFNFLDKYYKEEMRKKMVPEEEEDIQITDTERFLFTLFKDNKDKLQDLSKHPEYENKLLSELKTSILKEFTSRPIAMGIIFTLTRLSAIALSEWIQENSKFKDVGVNASYLIGGGDQSVVKPMTSAKQKDVLKKFRDQEINLLIATTVAEEGLDIPECNFVIRYGLVTNEIAMIQSRGRGRSEDSSYILVAEEGSGVAERESVNEYREQMMSKAINKVQNLKQEEYEHKIKELQMQALLVTKVTTENKKKKKMKHVHPSKVQFSCRGCSHHNPVCSGEDIQIIEEMHHVNVNEHFRKQFIIRDKTKSLQENLLDHESNGIIACKKCGRDWGSMRLYRGLECPSLNIQNFVVIYDDTKSTFNRWKELLIRFPAFDYSEHAQFSEDEDEDQDE